ncbi:Bug family tripartite tricarboxylate transporter substrate binding protein [Rhodoplanes sp. Z2-YC6860]|uniref:Bug family tripartite tricarboxylate transporter substrate binding protein n=1 Tax=Rhodoplanes sp. Z2-YC6860 TaxID=674703 RepID=UPI00078EA2E5|nr:tripartite tricarboxylate transporter substrate binding protein [Rhodoplanes sp. Z2-YC6860]AMN42917.1 extra-cytoplasmic solute receptor [Rhodoplanes sp. Z2-YC6860]
MMSNRMARSALAAAVFAIAAGSAAWAQDYPSRSLTIVVPYAAGGTLDTVARYIGNSLSEKFGKPVLVENRTGGGTVIGTNVVAKAAPDGYTLLMGSSTPLAINDSLYKKLPYDPKTDLKLLALVAASPLVMVVNPASPIRSYADLIAEAKAKPMSYASAGIGSPHHLFMELMMSIAGIHMTHIPYRGTLPALTDVVAGQLPVMFCDLISGLELMKAGKVRPIFAGTSARLPVLPDVPSAAEVGLSNFNAASWLGIAVTGGTPLPVQSKLHDEIIAIVKSEAFKSTVDKLGMTTMHSGSLEELDAFVKTEIVRWGEVVRVSGATAE